MGKYSDIPPEKFLDEAERILREAATQKGLTVWRGNFRGIMYPQTAVYECVVVGTGNPDNPPTKIQTFLAVRYAGKGIMVFEGSAFGNCMVPCGGNFHPLKNLEEERVPELPDIRQ